MGLGIKTTPQSETATHFVVFIRHALLAAYGEAALYPSHSIHVHVQSPALIYDEDGDWIGKADRRAGTMIEYVDEIWAICRCLDGKLSTPLCRVRQRHDKRFQSSGSDPQLKLNGCGTRTCIRGSEGSACSQKSRGLSTRRYSRPAALNCSAAAMSDSNSYTTKGKVLVRHHSYVMLHAHTSNNLIPKRLTSDEMHVPMPV